MTTKGLKQMTVAAMQAAQNVVVKKATKKQPVKKTAKAPKLIPVAVEDMKIGMTISGHGKVTSCEPFTGRGLKKKSTGPKGFLFITTEHPVNGCFYAECATVWCVK